MDVLSQLNHWLNTPGNEALHHAFTEFLRLVLLPARLPGIELPIMHELSEVRAMLSERVKEWTEQWKQQGLEQGLEQGMQRGIEQGIKWGLKSGLDTERALLLRQTQRRFGAPIAAQLQPLLAVVNDPEELAIIGEWLIDCGDGAEFLQQAANVAHNCSKNQESSQ
jgi:hypothetical protein